MNAVSYPRLIKRVRAVLIDSVVVPVVTVAVVILGTLAGVTDIWGRGALVVASILFLEPGLVALTGGTVGHHLVGIRVEKVEGTGNLNFFVATLRAIVKFVLGWLSFIFVLTTKKHQAIHDLVAHSVVVHRNVLGLPSYEILSERQVESEQFVYPAKWKRVLIVLLYWILVTIVVIFVLRLLSSDQCIRFDRCTTLDALASLVFNLVWLLSTGALVVLGWRGQLPGAKRRAVPSHDSAA